MNERFLAKNGSEIFKLNGNFICSSVDPVKEGQKWADEQRVQHSRTVIVLGVGCGYHLASLCEKYPDKTVIAIDIDKELIDFCKRVHLKLSNLELYHFRSMVELQVWSKMKRAISTSYTVQRYSPVTRLHGEEYLSISEFLAGRSEAGFKYICGLRKDFSHFIDGPAKKAPKLRALETGQVLSMAQVKKWVDDDVKYENWKHFFLLKALGELIA